MINEVRIFLSSPGDVSLERKRALRVIERVQNEYDGPLKLIPVAWEESFYTAREGFQQQIPKPSQTDLVVCILWKRLGSDLPPEYNRQDGSARTGTEWEFEEALDCAIDKEVPDILVYRKSDEVTFSEDNKDAEQRDFERLKHFWTKWFHNEQGHFTAGFQHFSDVDEFEVQFEKHFRQWLERRSGEIVWPVDLKGSPYPGLESFDEDRSEVFFGRRRALKELRARLMASALRGCAFTLVTGMSGSGKSSLVKAGLVPQLAQPGAVPQVDQWRKVVVRPGSKTEAPLLDLAEAFFTALPELQEGDTPTPADLANCWLNKPADAPQPVDQALEQASKTLREQEHFQREVSSRLFLVIDQLEELLQTADPLQLTYVEVLAALAKSGGTWVVATLRSDFHRSLMQLGPLKALCEEGGQYPLSPPGPAEIREIIQGPARAADITFETHPDTGESLDERLERVASNPGSLPLLQFTLLRLFEDRDLNNNVMKWSSYEDLGGMEGALSSHADKIFNNLPDTAKQSLSSVLLRLATVHQDNQHLYTSKTAVIYEFPDDNGSIDLIEAFSSQKARLFVTDEHAQIKGAGFTVRIAHDALLTHWDKAVKVLKTNSSVINARARISQLTSIWIAGGKKNGMLLSDKKILQDTKSLLKNSDLDLNQIEQDFLNRSLKKALKFSKVKKIIYTLFVTSLVIPVLFFMYSKYESTKIAKEHIDKAKEFSSTKDWTLALLHYNKGASEIKVFDIDDIEKCLINTWSEIAILSNFSSIPLSITASSDNKIVATLHEDSSIKIWRTKNATLLENYDILDNLKSIAISPDGNKLAACGDELYVIDLESMLITNMVSNINGTIYDVDFNPNSNSIIFGGSDKKIHSYNLDNDIVNKTYNGHTSSILSLSFNKKGDKFATGSRDNKVIKWNVSNTVFTSSNENLGDIHKTLFYKNYIIHTSGIGDINLVSEDMRTVNQFIGHKEIVNDLDVSRNSKLASASNDRTIRVWDIEDREIESILRGHKEKVNSIAFSPSSNYIFSASDDKTIRIWKRPTNFIATMNYNKLLLRKGDTKICSLSLSPNSQVVAFGLFDKTYRTIDVQRKAEKILFNSTEKATTIAFSKDGKRLAFASKSIYIFDTQSSKLIKTLSGHTKSIQSLSFSPKGDKIASASNDGTVRIWNISNKKSPIIIKGRSRDIIDVIFTPDGDHIVSTGIAFAEYENTVLINAHTGDIILDYNWMGVPTFRCRLAIHDDEFLTTITDSHNKIWSLYTGKYIKSNFRYPHLDDTDQFLVDNHVIEISRSWLYLYDDEELSGIFKDDFSMFDKFASSSDGRKIIWGNSFGDIYILETVTPKDYLATIKTILTAWTKLGTSIDLDTNNNISWRPVDLVTNLRKEAAQNKSIPWLPDSVTQLLPAIVSNL